MPVTAAPPEIVEVAYTLTDLPTSQHRAGLAGLLLLIDHLPKSEGAILEAVSRSEAGYTLRCNLAGITNLFDEVYAASTELVPSSTPRKDEEPAKVDEVQIVDDKTKKTKVKKRYFYPTVVPKGRLVDYFDGSPSKLWLKLWRDMTWTIMRGVPAQRTPFNNRADGKATNDSAEAWKQLCGGTAAQAKLASTYMLGAQDSNAEDVAFLDRAQNQFLLHFWTYAAQIYVPRVVDRENKPNFQGFVIAVPDILMLDSFRADFIEVLRRRGNDPVAYVPADSVIDLPEQAGLESIRRLKDTIRDNTSTQVISDLVYGFDIFHAEKIGNNIRLHLCARVEPERDRDAKYDRVRAILRYHQFRRQRLLNLVKHREWWHGFDSVLTLLPLEQGFASSFFASDARKCFDLEIKELKEMLTQERKPDADSEPTICLEEVILRIVDDYVRSKLRDKYQLEWSKLTNEAEKHAYSEKREAIGKEVFYAIRSRTGDDFINYFASTVCSVPHWMDQKQFVALSKELYSNTEKIRTLTMLALSARVARNTETKQGDK